jgi:hypothetical protein
MTKKELNELRKAVANYMYSEGCDCCRDTPKHEIDTKRLAELLGVPMYEDGSGYDFFQFREERAA